MGCGAAKGALEGLSQKEKRKTDALFDESRATRHRATYYNVYHEYSMEDDLDRFNN